MRVAKLAAEQNLVISTSQLRACGLSGSALTLRTRRGTLHRVHRGAYSVVHPEALTLKGRVTAAAPAAGRGAVASGWATAAWWDLLAWDGRDPEVTVPGDSGRKIDGIVTHRTRLDRRDIWF